MAIDCPDEDDESSPKLSNAAARGERAERVSRARQIRDALRAERSGASAQRREPDWSSVPRTSSEHGPASARYRDTVASKL